MIKVCHFTSAHKATDVRIFKKECVSLAHNGYDVYLVAPNAKNAVVEGVHIEGISLRKRGRIKRFILTAHEVYKKALSLDADIYHFHDPDLIPYGVKLSRHGKQVIYDSHEDYRQLMLAKQYIPKIFRPVVSTIFTIYEKYACKKFSGLSLCYHWTRDRLLKCCSNCELVFNFPILSDNYSKLDSEKLSKKIAYVGGISSQWCVDTILNSLQECDDVKLLLAGPLDGNYIDVLRANGGWKHVLYLGQLPSDEVYKQIYSQVSIGMALLDYIPQCMGHVGNMSNTKLFEYMMAGLPVLCTDFTMWKDVVEGNHCGLCVNPHDKNAVTNAIKYMYNHPFEMAKMSENARNAAVKFYNWKTEETKLLKLYSNVASKLSLKQRVS